MTENLRQSKINYIKADMKINLVSKNSTPCPNGCMEVSAPNRACNGCLESRLRGLMSEEEIKLDKECWV